jgi:hypothetical protein
MKYSMIALSLLFTACTPDGGIVIDNFTGLTTCTNQKTSFSFAFQPQVPKNVKWSGATRLSYDVVTTYGEIMTIDQFTICAGRYGDGRIRVINGGNL